MPRKPINYSKTTIYKIVPNDKNINTIYIGHTTNFANRKNGHKQSCNNPNNKSYNLKLYSHIRNNGGWGNFSMIEIEKYICNDENEAKQRERYFYDLLKPELNSNRMMVTNDETKQLKRDYAKSDKRVQFNKSEKQVNYRKNYTLNHMSKMKQYQIENKDKIALRKKIKYNEQNDCMIQQRVHFKKYEEDVCKIQKNIKKLYKELYKCNEQQQKEKYNNIINEQIFLTKIIDDEKIYIINKMNENINI